MGFRSTARLGLQGLGQNFSTTTEVPSVRSRNLKNEQSVEQQKIQWPWKGSENYAKHQEKGEGSLTVFALSDLLA